jgi:hypothetical protein
MDLHSSSSSRSRSQGTAALRDFRAADVRYGSIASDRYAARGRGMSASPPEATELMQRHELSRCANRVLTHCNRKALLFDHLVQN